MTTDLTNLRRLAEALGAHRILPWFVRVATGAEYATDRKHDSAYYVTSVPPEHPCWKNDNAAYTGLGVWGSTGVTDLHIAEYIAAANPAAILSLLDQLVDARSRLAASRDEVDQLQSEAAEVDKLLAESADKWQALIASAAHICGHCKTPVPIEDMQLHIRSCPSNPMVADLTARDATIAELRALLLDLAEDTSHLSSCALAYPPTASECDCGTASRLARIDAALVGKERG